MGKHTATGADREVTVRQLAIPAAKRRHPAGNGAMRRAVLVLAAAGVLAGTSTGIASAAPSPQSVQGQACHVHPDLPQCVNQYDQDYRPSWSMVDPSVLRNGGKFTVTQRIHAVENEVLDALANVAHRLRRLV